MERWALTFLVALLEGWRTQTGSDKDRFEDRIENVREVIRNVMTYVGPRLSSLATLWSVLTSFRIAIAELPQPGEECVKEAPISFERMQEILDKSPISGAAVPTTKFPISNLVYNCPFCGVLSKELGEALRCMRTWWDEIPDSEGLHSGLEDLILFLVDLHNNILTAQTATPELMTGW